MVLHVVTSVLAVVKYLHPMGIPHSGQCTCQDGTHDFGTKLDEDGNIFLLPGLGREVFSYILSSVTTQNFSRCSKFVLRLQ
jgi:hypothetical protein